MQKPRSVCITSCSAIVFKVGRYDGLTVSNESNESNDPNTIMLAMNMIRAKEKLKEELAVL